MRCDGRRIIKFPIKDYKKDEEKIKKLIEGAGGKWTSSVYIAVNNAGNWEIWNLQLLKAPLTGAKEKDKTKYLGIYNLLYFPQK